MNNADLIERAQPLYADSDPIIKELADALELADKRIAELEAKIDEAYRKGYATGEEEAEHKLSVAREELLRCKEIMLHECGIGLVNEVVLAQIGGEDASS